MALFLKTAPLIFSFKCKKFGYDDIILPTFAEETKFKIRII